MSSIPPHAASDSPPAPVPHQRARYWIAGTLGVLVLIVGAVAICEWRGWPMLRRPAEDYASQRLDREVSFAGSGARWRLHLLGGVRLQLDHLEVSAPKWSSLGDTLVANNVELKLHYHDLFAFRHGQPLRIESLKAETLALRVQRLEDGRASWQFGPADAAGRSAGKGFDGVRFELLQVGKGMAIVDDKLSTLSMTANFSLQDASDPGVSSKDGNDKRGLRAEAEGRFRGSPLRATLRSGAALPWLAADPQAPAVDVVFKLDAGQAALDFKGQLRDLMLSALDGDYALRGPSLAAVGEPLGVTLPTTPPFAMQGHLKRSGPRWATQVAKATIGRSTLDGDFVYDRSQPVPMLSGKVHARELWLADLGPAIGTRGGLAVTGPAPRAGLGLKVAAPQKVQATRTAGPGRVLPDRPFDLPSLRAMNADVNMRIDRLESGSERLKAIEPLNTHLVLRDGVLTLDDIDARLAQGRLAGSIVIDGRQPAAIWKTKLSVRDVRLEQWLLQQGTDTKGAASSPWVTGRLAARIDLSGRGRSTADFLASAGGSAQLYWTQGTVSHRLVEMSGIDVAQTLGLMVRGDDRLPVSCATADLRAKDGMVRPQYMLVDTPDSAIRVDGGVSLATERLGLTLHVAPKDISPLTLRTPVDVGGTFAHPDISLQKAPLARRLLPAVALAAVTPLAGLIPLIDMGDKSARAAAEECQAAVRRSYAAIEGAAPTGAGPGDGRTPPSVGQH